MIEKLKELVGFIFVTNQQDVNHDLPLVSNGPSGIGGEYQVDTIEVQADRLYDIAIYNAVNSHEIYC